MKKLSNTKADKESVVYKKTVYLLQQVAVSRNCKNNANLTFLNERKQVIYDIIKQQRSLNRSLRSSSFLIKPNCLK